MVASMALALGLLVPGDRGGSPGPGAEAAAAIEAADVVWRYDTGG
jgi:hypothetical protein